MAKIPHIIFYDALTPVISMKALESEKLVAVARDGGKVIIARYGVNKSTLKKMLKRR